MHAKTILVNGIEVLAQRLSYAGEKGWELYAAFDKAIILWDKLWAAGKEHDIVVAGYKAIESLRLEKRYLYYSSDITALDDPFSAGLGFTVDLDDAEFIGRNTLKEILDDGVQTRLCTITIGGEEWLPLYGAEAVLAEGRVISRLRSSGYGHTVKKNIGFAYLPLAFAKIGTQLEIEIFSDMVPAQVAPQILYDPKGEVLRK